MPKIWPSPIFEKNFFRSKIPEICRKSPFLQILFGFFPLFRCSFSYKNITDIAFSFVRSSVRSFVRSYFHYQLGPISMWLVFMQTLLHFLVPVLHLHKFEQLDKIWDDQGSGATVSCSVWRTTKQDGFYSLGDIFIAGSRTKPNHGYLLKVEIQDKEDVLKVPQSYTKLWTDSGSGADKDLAIWKLQCPTGYMDLGNAATDGSEPQPGDVYCLKRVYVQEGSMSDWKYVWNDAGTGARQDLTIYRSGDGSQFTANGFGAVASHSEKPSWDPQFLAQGPVLMAKDES